MNGTPAQIEVIKPFENAFALMKKILFQPFDAKKWFVIGFSAWLARLGTGFNFNYRTRNDPQFRQFADSIRQIPTPLLITIIISVVIICLVLAVLFAWLRSRGRFMFTDNIVKNQAAIAAPWREFRREGNSYFLFALLVGGCFFVFAAILSLPFMLPIIRGVTFLHLHDFYLISMIVLWAGVICVFSVFWTLISNMMVVMMYRHRCSAGEGFRRSISLINAFPGEITLFCLFSVAVGLGAVFAACVVICATCCVAAIPYLGTVVLLPVWTWTRSFTLLFFRQFGPDYDVWGGQTPANELALEVVPGTPPPLPT